MEKREEELKSKVNGLKDTLSNKQDKLKTLQRKYDNIKKGLKAAKGKLKKSKEKVTSLEQAVTDLKNEARKKFIQSLEYKEHIGQAMVAAVRDMIFTTFLKNPNLDYSCLGEAILELVAGYKLMARDGKIKLETPLL